MENKKGSIRPRGVRIANCEFCEDRKTERLNRCECEICEFGFAGKGGHPLRRRFRKIDAAAPGAAGKGLYGADLPPEECGDLPQSLFADQRLLALLATIGERRQSAQEQGPSIGCVLDEETQEITHRYSKPAPAPTLRRFLIAYYYTRNSQFGELD
jgi:hypothetical protein